MVIASVTNNEVSSAYFWVDYFSDGGLRKRSKELVDQLIILLFRDANGDLAKKITCPEKVKKLTVKAKKIIAKITSC